MDEIFIVSSTINKGGASHCAVMLSKNISKPKIMLYSIIPDIDFETEEVEDVFKISTSSSNSILKRCFIYIYSLNVYTKQLYSKKPYISMSINSLSHTINLLACFITRTKCVIAVHDDPNHNINYIHKLIKLTPIILSRILNAKIITVSNGLKRQLVAKYHIPEENISVLYNPCDMKDIVQKSLEDVDTLFIQEKVPIIISVGNVIPVKGHWHLLRVFDKVCEYIPCKLVICGDTTRDENYMQYLSTLLENMRYKNNVQFIGWTANPYKYIKKSTIFVLSSLSEGLPYCLVEALACGCPIVASNCVDGIGEILNGGKYGLLSKKLDETYYSASDPLTDAEIDMMEKIIYLLENPDVRQDFARRGMERAKDFDKEICVEKYVQYFENIM